MRRILWFLVLLIVTAVGCSGRSSTSPTPFPTTGPTSTPPGTGPIVLTVTELMSAPGLYRDAVVQLTGLLRKQPLIVCDTELHPSPAGWGLGEEGVLALAGGFEQQVRSLLPDNMTMTVEGRWRRWEGLVGCGKQATQQEVWFLEASRVLSPSPLTQVTLTPASGIEIVAITETPTIALESTIASEGFPTPSLEETPVTPESTAGSAALATPTPDLFEPTQFPTSGLTGTVTIGTPDGTPALGTTGTPAGTPSPTVTGTPPTPTATGTTTSGSGQVVAKGNLYDVMTSDFIISSLPGGAIDSWELDLFEGESLYVYAIAPTPVDVILSVLKDGQPIVNRQNTAPTGSPEFINGPSLQGEGLYEIQVLTVGGASTDYALTFYTDPETAIIIPGIITSGSPRSAVQMPAGAFHYWFFVASPGSNISVLLTPLGEEDPGVYIMGPDGEEIDSADDGFEGEEESIETSTNLSGLHAIGVEEVYGDALSYDLELTLQ